MMGGSRSALGNRPGVGRPRAHVGRGTKKIKVRGVYRNIWFLGGIYNKVL